MASKVVVTHRTRNAIIGGFIAASFSGIMIFRFHGRLIPDTNLYAHAKGPARWSSPLFSLIGLLFGLIGIQIFAIIFAFLLGIVIVNAGSLLALFSVIIIPSGWSIGYAGADAAGAFGSSISYGRSFYFIILTGVFHLEAGICSFCIFLYMHFFNRFVSIMAIGTGLGAQIAQWHVQVRYFLPGICVAIVRRGNLPS